MSERINTPYTSEHFVAFCLSMLGQPYWYGTVVYKCSESLRSRKAKQYPSHYKDSRTARYKQDIANKKVCADCVGLIKGYNWTSGGVGVREAIGTDKTFSSKYGGNGCPDKSANGMFTYAKSNHYAERDKQHLFLFRFSASLRDMYFLYHTYLFAGSKYAACTCH